MQGSDKILFFCNLRFLLSKAPCVSGICLSYFYLKKLTCNKIGSITQIKYDCSLCRRIQSQGAIAFMQFQSASMQYI
jgi:hypothetical protein